MVSMHNTSSYLTENTVHVHYKDLSVNTARRESHQTQKYLSAANLACIVTATSGEHEFPKNLEAARRVPRSKYHTEDSHELRSMLQ